MAQGKKTTSEERASILMKKIDNPDLSSRDIAGEVSVGHNTVNTIINEELGQLSTNEKKNEIIDVNLEIIRKGKALISSSIGTLPLERYNDLTNLSNVVEQAFKQNQLLSGGATENIKGIGAILSEIQGK